MITPDEIKVKAERCYLAFLQSWLRGEPYVPLRFPAGKSPDTFSPLRAAIQQLQIMAKAQKGYGYYVEMRQQQTRSLGMQTRPVAVIFETAEDFLRFIEKESEFQSFQQDVTQIREQLPQLASWMERYPKKVIAQHGFWPSLLIVCRYFLEHPQPALYIRELPINLHTKFVEEHRGILRELLEALLPAETILPDAPTFQQRFGLREGEPHVHARFLDDQLDKQYGLPLNELSTPCSQFAQLQFKGHRCLITENKMTFLTLPPIPDTFAILGGGFAVSALAAIPWLSQCPMIYWGDLDAQGFQILSQLRSFFPHVLSLMMDDSTFHTFAAFWVLGTPCPVQHLPYLTEEEHMLFTHLVKENIRLEQEHISHAYALTCIQECLQQTT
jgi:hypothetical protein